MSRWEELTGRTSGEGYAARFAALAESGKDMHGEARLCATLVPTGAAGGWIPGVAPGAS